MSYAIREAFAAFRRAPVLTGLAAAMVGLALTVLGIFGLVAFNLQAALQQVEERVEVVAYLRDDVTNVEIETAVIELEALPEVDGVRWVSKEEALEQARADLIEFEEVFSGLQVNPLPSSLEIRLGEAFRTEEAIERVVAVADVYPFVEGVEYGREWVQRVFALRRVAGATAGIIGIAFALVAALIIGTALRIAIFARRDEISIMRLVGARDSFIRAPFLIEGGLTGLFGGVLALALTWLTFRSVSTMLISIAWLPFSWAAGGVIGGTLFGAVASSLAVRRHLREVE